VKGLNACLGETLVEAKFSRTLNNDSSHTLPVLSAAAHKIGSTDRPAGLLFATDIWQTFLDGAARHGLQTFSEW
jgi:hypothetical protein